MAKKARRTNRRPWTKQDVRELREHSRGKSPVTKSQGNGCPVATQGFSALLAVAIKIAPDRPTKDEHRDPAADLPIEQGQPYLGGASHSRRTAYARY
jgi:hypothetical protein